MSPSKSSFAALDALRHLARDDDPGEAQLGVGVKALQRLAQESEAAQREGGEEPLVDRLRIDAAARASRRRLACARGVVLLKRKEPVSLTSAT